MDELGLKPGDELVHADDSAIRAVVDGPDHIRLGGERMRLSPAAVAVADRLGTTPETRAIQGGTKWIFDGETLVQRRLRLESAADDLHGASE
jgi:hypothetical protein